MHIPECFFQNVNLSSEAVVLSRNSILFIFIKSSIFDKKHTQAIVLHLKSHIGRWQIDEYQLSLTKCLHSHLTKEEQLRSSVLLKDNAMTPVTS